MFEYLAITFLAGWSVSLTLLHFFSPHRRQKSDTVSWDAGYSAGISVASRETISSLDEIKKLRSPIGLHDIETIVRRTIKKIESTRE